MSTFQTVLLIIFGIFLLIGVLIFSGIVPGLSTGGKSGLSGQAVLWGTIPASSMAQIVDDFNREHKPMVLVYVEKNPATLDHDLTEALASGTGPDMVMLPNTLIYRHAGKVYPIPYATLSERTFRDTFVEEGELYLTQAGILALPFKIDPMVMYYNRDMLSSAGVALPPKTWEELNNIAPKITVKDNSGNIIKSTVSFGEYGNVNYAKDIISLLVMQAGSPISKLSQSGYTSVLGKSDNISLKPGDEAVRYYTNFSNPVQPVYSWNKAMPNSRNAFLSGALAFYFGYSSELLQLRALNPHLNFDVAKVPQAKGSSAVATFGRVDGIAILKVSRNPALAFSEASILVGADNEAKLTRAIFTPPTRRDLLSQKPADAFMNVFFDSALMSKGWMDPSPYDTENIFKELVDNVVSGRLRISDAVLNADGELDRLFGGGGN